MGFQLRSQMWEVNVLQLYHHVPRVQFQNKVFQVISGYNIRGGLEIDKKAHFHNLMMKIDVEN